MNNKKINKSSLVIALNKRASFNFFIEEEIEAGLVLQGWEIKSLRAGKVNIDNSYAILKDGEAFFLGAHFTPTITSSSHYVYNPIRIRKLLLNHCELEFLYSKINRIGYTIIILSLYWKNSWCKVKIGIAKGKKQHDKRTSLKEREWQLYKARITKNTKY